MNFFILSKGFKIIPDFIKPSFISLAVLTALSPSPCTQIESILQGIFEKTRVCIYRTYNDTRYHARRYNKHKCK